MQGEEYLEMTEKGPVRVILVRVNVNPLARTCEQIVCQKKEIHTQSFEQAVGATLEQGNAFAMRLEKDSVARLVILNVPGWRGLKQVADSILKEYNKQLEEHHQLAPSRFLEDTLFQALVHEMLSVVRMGRFKLQLYLEDPSRCPALPRGPQPLHT